MKVIRPPQETLNNAASQIRSLPPKPLIDLFKRTKNLSNESAFKVRYSWICIGRALDEYFRGASLSTSKLNLPPELELKINEDVALLGTLSLACFQAESIIREEAKKIGWSFVKNLSWKDFVILCALDYCEIELWVETLEAWETPAVSQIDDRLKTLSKILEEKFPPEKEPDFYAQCDTEDSRLYRSGSDKELNLVWSSFLISVLSDHRDKIASYRALKPLLFTRNKKLLPSKAFMQKGEPARFYNRRNKAKTRVSNATQVNEPTNRGNAGWT